jgi:thymidylate kinase
VHRLIVITGLDGSGTSTIAQMLCNLDSSSLFLQTPTCLFSSCREQVDKKLRLYSIEAHYHFYLSSVIHASQIIKDHLSKGNVYCVRYLMDTVVSHRAAGMNVELLYNTDTYKIKPPDLTFFLHVPEKDRQNRINERGKGFLDSLLDQDNYRNRFLQEFRRFENQYHTVSNASNNPNDAVVEIVGRMGIKGGL